MSTFRQNDEGKWVQFAHGRDAISDMQALRKLYRFVDIEAMGLARERHMACPVGGEKCRRRNCICDVNNRYVARAEWYDARRAWLAEVAEGAVALVCDYGAMFTVRVFFGRLYIDDTLKFHADRIVQAATAHYDGGIMNGEVWNPETLKGYLYRGDVKRHSSVVEGYFLPKDVIEHLLALRDVRKWSVRFGEKNWERNSERRSREIRTRIIVPRRKVPKIQSRRAA